MQNFVVYGLDVKKKKIKKKITNELVDNFVNRLK